MQWLEAGTTIVWVVERKQRTVTVYRADGSATVLRAEDTISGEPVLPGFAARVGSFFE